MEKEKFKYFISYVVNNQNFHNAEIIRDGFIESFEDIQEIERELKKNHDHSTIIILNYRVF